MEKLTERLHILLTKEQRRKIEKAIKNSKPKKSIGEIVRLCIDFTLIGK